MFFKANISGFVTIVIAGVIYFFFQDIRNIPIMYVLPLCYLDIWLFKIFFEYQRITLTISRIARMNNSRLSIIELQFLMSDPVFSTLFFFKSILTGFLAGYLLLNSFIYLLVFLVLHLLISLVPTYVPYSHLFRLIGKELKKPIENSGEQIEKIRLEKYFEEISHTSSYENSAIEKYGDGLLSAK